MKNASRLVSIFFLVAMALTTNLVGVMPTVQAAHAQSMSTPSTKWLHVSGTHLVNGAGQQIVLRGAEVESPFDYVSKWKGGSTVTQVLNSNVFNAMVQGWKMNVLRVCISNWIYASDPTTYMKLLDQVIQEANTAGLYVVLNLHDDGNAGSPYGNSAIFPKQQDETFWQMLASHYKNNPMLLFDLYNEPHEVGWSTWLYGHIAIGGVMVVGHQDLVDTIRAAGAKQIVIVEPGFAGGNGTGWATIGTNTINDPNVMYSAHIYQQLVGSSQQLDTFWGPLLHNYPLYYGEWGLIVNGKIAHCQNIVPSQADQDVNNFLSYMASRNADWTAWDFNPYHLIQNYTNFAPTTLDIPWVCGQPSHAGMGTLVKTYLTGAS